MSTFLAWQSGEAYNSVCPKTQKTLLPHPRPGQTAEWFTTHLPLLPHLHHSLMAQLAKFQGSCFCPSLPRCTSALNPVVSEGTFDDIYPCFFQEQTPPPELSPDGRCPILYSQTSWHRFMQSLPSEDFPGVRSSFFATCIEYSALDWQLLSEASSVILILCCPVA